MWLTPTYKVDGHMHQREEEVCVPQDSAHQSRHLGETIPSVKLLVLINTMHPSTENALQLSTRTAHMATTFASVPSADFALKSIDLTVEPGQLVGIVGPVGSAKSSLLMAVLREMAPVQDGGGREVRINNKNGATDAWNLGVYVGGKVAYAPQEPWIQSGTVRDNILFGKPMDRRR